MMLPQKVYRETEENSIKQYQAARITRRSPGDDNQLAFVRHLAGVLLKTVLKAHSNKTRMGSLKRVALSAPLVFFFWAQQGRL
jgi:hypothetical protein